SREAGMTRDRRIEKAEWIGHHFRVVDTGGLQDDDDTLSRLISQQAMKAIQDSDLIFFVVDSRDGLTAADHEIASMLRRIGKPVLVGINKIDSPSKLGAGSEFHELGFEKAFEVSAEHGLGVDEILDEAVDILHPPKDSEETSTEASIVILGKPNAG